MNAEDLREGDEYWLGDNFVWKAITNAQKYGQGKVIVGVRYRLGMTGDKFFMYADQVDSVVETSFGPLQARIRRGSR